MEHSLHFTLMLGDDIYGSKSPEDFKKKFEEPYHDLLDAGVKFYASLGNHDEMAERAYKPFNMNGKPYYNFRKGNAEFFALDSNYMDPEQVRWIDQQLGSSDATWKICFFHHPLYSDGKTHGPSLDLRKQIEPIFQAHGVGSNSAGTITSMSGSSRRRELLTLCWAAPASCVRTIFARRKRRTKPSIQTRYFWQWKSPAIN